jgi:tetratricopeptide (TPR) repeat protein
MLTLRYVDAQHPEAEKLFQQALDLLKKLPRHVRDRREYRYALACCYDGRALLHHAADQHQDSEKSFRQALKLWEGLGTDYPNKAQYQFRWSGTLHNLSQGLRERGKVADAEQLFKQGIKHIQAALNLDPNNSTYHQGLCDRYDSLAAILNRQGNHIEAVKAGRQGVAEQKKLVARFADVPDFHWQLARGQFNLAVSLVGCKQYAAAEKLYREALPTLQELVKKYPHNPDYQNILGAVFLGLAHEVGPRGKVAEARQLALKAIDHVQIAVNHRPQSPKYRQRLQDGYFTLAEALVRLHDHDEAAKVLVKYANLFPEGVEEQVQTAKFFVYCASGVGQDAKVSLATRQDIMGRYADQALALLPDGSKPAKSASPATVQAELGSTHNDLGLVLRSAGRPAGAEKAFRRALAIQEKLVADHPKVADYRSALGGSLHNLAEQLRDRDELTEACELLERAISHQRIAWKPKPRHPTYRRFLHSHYWVLAALLVQRKEHAAAVKAAAELPRVVPDGWQEYVRAAAFLAHCMPLAEQDTKLLPEARKKTAQAYGDRAVQLLAQAIDKGLKDPQHLKEHPNLGPLRSRKDFQKLVTGLEKVKADTKHEK